LIRQCFDRRCVIHQALRRGFQNVDAHRNAELFGEVIIVARIRRIVAGKGALVGSVVDHGVDIGGRRTDAHRGRIVEQQIKIDIGREARRGGRLTGDRCRWNAEGPTWSRQRWRTRS
jgi:hypothetical protein